GSGVVAEHLGGALAQSVDHVIADAPLLHRQVAADGLQRLLAAALVGQLFATEDATQDDLAFGSAQAQHPATVRTRGSEIMGVLAEDGCEQGLESVHGVLLGYNGYVRKRPLS